MYNGTLVYAGGLIGALVCSIFQSIQIGPQILPDMNEISEDGFWQLINGEWVPREERQASPNAVNVGAHSHQNVPAVLQCQACDTLLLNIERNYQGKIECNQCGFLFNYPTLTNQQQLIARLGKIERRLYGISNTIWLVFFLIPLIVGMFFFFLI